MKRIWKNLLFVLITLIFCITPTFAKEIDLKTLGDLVLDANPNAESFYVVGKYVFTMNYVGQYHLNAEDLMIAARSIDVSTEEGEINNTVAYEKMTVYQIISDPDDDGNIIGWDIGKNFVGSHKIAKDAKFEIKYIDYKPVEEVYTVTFLDDEEKVVTKEEVIFGKKVTAPSVDSRTGYILEWHKCNDDSCSTVEDEPFDFNTEIKSDIKLKEVWIANKYKLTFEDDTFEGGSKEFSYTYPNVTPTDQVNLKPNEKPGYEFEYWYDAETDENTEFNFNKELTKDVTLKAKWKQNKRIAHFKGIIDGQEDNRFLEGKEELILPDSNKAPEEYLLLENQTGYTFKGWTLEDGRQINLNGYIFTNPNTTVIGTWESNKYTVTFDSDDGDVIGNRVVSYGSQVQTPGVAHKAGVDSYNGYEFVGWFKCNNTTDCSNVETEETAYDFDTPVTDNIKLKAKYKNVVYTNKMVNNFVDAIDNDDFSAVVDEENAKITFNVINKETLLSVNYVKVKEAIEKLQKVKNVTDITINYDDNKTKTITSETDVDDILLELFNDLTGVNYNEAKLENFYKKGFKLTINLRDGYKNEENKRADVYNVEFIHDYVEVSNIEELKDNLDKGKEIIIKNWQGETITKAIEIDHDIVIDFRNTTVKSAVTDSKYTFIIKSGVNVSIKDLKLEIAVILPSEYNKDERSTKNTIGIKVEDEATLTVNNYSVVTNINIDRELLKIGGENYNSTNVAINENAAIELHGTLYGSQINYDAEIYGSPTVLATESATMNLRGLNKSTYIYNVNRTNNTTKGTSDRFEKVEGFIHYYKDYNNSYLTFVFYSTSSPQAVFALLYNENIIIPEVFKEGGELYNLNGKTLKKWNSRNYDGSKTSTELQEQKIKNHETIYLYAKYE